MELGSVDFVALFVMLEDKEKLLRQKLARVVVLKGSSTINMM